MNKIIHVNECIPISRGGKKIVSKMMKLVLIILVVSLQVSAAEDGYSQRVTLSVKNAPLKSVLQSIRKQSGYSFLYKDDQFINAKPVTISVKERPIEEILQVIFKDQPIGYTIQDKIIIVQSRGVESSAGTEFVELTNIKGTVVDKDGQPLVGATVIVVGMSNKGATTNERGEFKLNGVPVNGKVLVRMIGYETKEVVYGEGVVLNVRLRAVESDLDEVHVIAYGTTSKRLTTGNIGGIKAKDIEQQPVTNPLLALQGRLPGVFINQNSGYAGGGVTVRIQGQNSINYGNDPFYVVDGVPYISQVLPTRSSVLVGSGAPQGVNESGAGNPFSFLNPADIESIDVLKDADATAIYGSRAANGAILITTKKGKAGQTKIDFTIQNGAGKVGRKMKLLNTQQYLEMRREAYINDGLAVPTPANAKNSSNFDLTVFDQNRYTDWQKEIYGGTANYTNAQLTISGGNATTTFRLNGGYHRQTTVLPVDFADKKASLGVSIDHSSNDNKFKLLFSSNFQYDNNRLPASDILSTILLLPPNAPAIRHADGTLNWNQIETNPITHDSVSTWTNPLSYLENTYQIKTSNLVSNLNLSYLLTKGLTLKASLGYTDMIASDVARYPLSQYAPERRTSSTRGGEYSDSRVKSWIFEPQLNYNFDISGGQASFLFGTTFQENTSDLKAIGGDGYNSDEVIGDFRAASNIIATASIQSMYKYNAVFGRFNYNWQGKYILNLTARRDGSSRFGKENRFQNFGAIGAAWLFSNENFIKNSFAFLSFGKIRASYGTTGNDQIGNYTYLNLYSNITPAIPYQNFTGLTPDGLPNPYLQWELTKKLQGGIDIGFLNDRILFSANYYKNRSSNQLLEYTLPAQTGFGGILQNFPAKIENKGWEFTLNTINFSKRNFSWSSSFNLTISRNKLLDFPDLETSSYASRLIIGKPIGIVKKYDFAGVNSETGKYQYRTYDGKIVMAPQDNIKDMYVPVDLSPRCYGGIQNSFTYKDFNLDFLFQFVRQNGQDIKTGFGNRLGNRFNQPVEVLERWQKPGDQTNVQKFSNTTPIQYISTSTANFGDASYIRLKNIAFSYNLPAKLTKTIHLDRCRVFAQGQNIFTITHYVGLDPETPGNGTMPPLITITLGLQVTL
jgi:TonB-linked SusC/RagA family outer membrane protein